MFTDEQLAAAGINPKAYQNLRPEEKAVVDEVLREFAEQGRSDILDTLYDTDYDERPVDFIQFITDDAYLGKTTRNGEFLYPFWSKEIQKIYSLPDVSEVAFSGSIGIGKTTAAVLAMVYHLYKIMCMKDPQAFFNLSPGSEITYAFLNNTLSSSYGVAYKTFQAFIQESPWFLKHGKIAGRTTPEYYPEKGFGFIVGSRPQHTLGKHVIAAIMDEVSFAPGQNVSYEKCLTGDTVIKTTEGDFRLDELGGKQLKVYNYSPDEGKVLVSEECTVVKTMETTEIIEIEMEDGTVIKCTPFHRLMLKDGTYKMAKDLSEEDELLDIN